MQGRYLYRWMLATMRKTSSLLALRMWHWAQARRLRASNRDIGGSVARDRGLPITRVAECVAVEKRVQPPLLRFRSGL